MRGAAGLQDTDTPYSTGTDGDNSSNIITRAAGRGELVLLISTFVNMFVYVTGKNDSRAQF